MMLFVDTGREETIVSLRDESGDWVSSWNWDDEKMESLGIAWRNLDDEGDRALVFAALLACYQTEGAQFHV